MGGAGAMLVGVAKLATASADEVVDTCRLGRLEPESGGVLQMFIAANCPVFGCGGRGVVKKTSTNTLESLA
jgi:hypothetical protein